jgi:hypothetical protein
MRGSSRVLNIVNSFFELEIGMPSWSAGRLWLLRIGLYKLERPKTIAEDWIWIIDHTVQLGNQKCMVILGVRQKSLPMGELYLTHEDVEPIALIPVEKSNGDVVFQQLEETIEKTGIPKQIVSDHGPDIKNGSERFCEKYDIILTYDMKHKGAVILKRELNGDPDWEEFCKQAGKTSKKVQQTNLAGFAPPNQRSKARYMNADKLVYWAMKILCRLDVEQEKSGDDFKSGAMCEKLSWVYDYRDQLNDWNSLVEIIGNASRFVNFMGLTKGLAEDLRVQLDELPKNRKFDHIKKEVVEFVQQQQMLLEDNDRLLGSSEIIESVIGKYKSLQNDQVKGGFTGMLLGLAASVSEFSMETVKNAIDSTPTKKVWRWVKEKVGESVHSQRKAFHFDAKNQEQKLADKLCANE